LIKSVSFERLGEVQKIVEESVLSGERHEGLRDKLIAQFGVTKSRASLIARDQTLKLTSQLNQQRATSVGVQTYTWITSRDERVRPGHKALDGTIQRYDSPPVTNPRTGERNHAGEDYQCRCVAAPNTDELLGIDEVQEAAGVPLPEPLKPSAAPAPQERRVALERQLDAVHAQAIQGMQRKGRLFVGPVPQEFTQHLQAQREHVAEVLGLRPTRPFTSTAAIDKDDAKVGDAFMGWDGRFGTVFHEDPQDQRVMVHELVHTMGGASQKAYSGNAARIEEVVTEHLAHDYMGTNKAVKGLGELLPVATPEQRARALKALDDRGLPQIRPLTYGSYDRYRKDVKAVIAAGKQTEDADKIQGLLSDAAKRWKAKSYDTPERAIEAFIDALQPATAAERLWYEAALRDREWQE
jgi:SPP1 gp7 family putative phage head morphogenesis protein